MNRAPLLLMILVTLLAAAGWLFSKEAIRELPTAAFIGSRFLLAALLLLPLAWLREPPPSRSQLLRAAGCGTLLGASLLFWVTAISQSDALGSGAFIMSVATLMAPLAAWAAFKARPGRHYWLTLPIAVAGLLLLSSSTHWGVSLSLFWFLAAAATLGVQLAVHRHFAQSIPPTWLTCIQLAVTGLIGTLLSLLTEQWPADISSGVWGWFAASVLIATTLRYWLLTHALSQMTTAHAALLMLRRDTLARELADVDGFAGAPFLDHWYGIAAHAMTAITFSVAGAWNQTPGPDAGQAIALEPDA